MKKELNMRMLLAIGLSVGLAAGALSQEESLKPLALGSSAPDFSLPGVDGKTYSLADFKNAKFLIVLFTSNHCPTAQAYEERVKQIVVDYAPKGVQVVGIQPNSTKGLRLDELGYTELGDSFEDMKLRAKEKGFNFPYIDDGATQTTAKAYGCKATPHVFVFDPDRKLCYAGRIDDSERPEYVKVHDLRNALDALIAGKEVPVKTTPAFGCSTKWASKEESVKKYMEKVASEPVSVTTIDEVGLAALAKNDSGKLRLVSFWSTTCIPCLEEMPDLVDINRMYRHRAFEMVTVAANYPDEKEEVERLLKKFACSSRNHLLAGTDKYKQLAAFDKEWDAALPYTVLLGVDGRVLYKANGKINPVELRKKIVDTLGRYMDPPKKK
ncbi:MAG TPA: redoxin family protein [Planctomycetota bacterium]|nr:redoxin family protein [Planctomycetota bacterium]